MTTILVTICTLISQAWKAKKKQSCFPPKLILEELGILSSGKSWLKLQALVSALSIRLKTSFPAVILKELRFLEHTNEDTFHLSRLVGSSLRRVLR
jgi:hypothetical protein